MPSISDFYALVAVKLFNSTLDQETDCYDLVENE